MDDIDERMFDFHEFYDRMAQELPDNAQIVEVGVADCASALYLAKKLHDLDKSFKLYMVDDLSYGKEEQLSTIIRNVTKSGLADYIEIIPMDSLNASCKFNDGSLNLVFIDASHLYQYTKADVRLWFHKVIDGGILAGHDAYSPAVEKAIKEVIPGRQVYVNEEAATKVLYIEPTSKDFGLWYLRKNWQIQIK